MPSKWGDLVPHVAPSRRDGHDGWSIYGKPAGGQVCNCPALMGEPFPHWPERFEDVPRMAYDPAERLKALDIDGVDAEVLFPNPPGGSYYSYKDPGFELDAVRAYNDILSDWVRVSDRFWPLAALPWLQSPQDMAREIERAVEGGHRGVNVMGTPPRGLPALTDPHWDPIWDVCQSLGVPIHFHGSSGINAGGSTKSWSGYSERQEHSASTSTSAVTPAQVIPMLIFSGVTERFPSLKVVFAEAGIGGFNYVLAACDHEWEARHLWTEGMDSRPSDTIRRQMFVNFWFEAEGIKLRHEIGIENIMWESDFPHVASYYPRSWNAAERVLDGVPQEDRPKLLYENALRVYGVKATGSPGA
ncbi:MAG: amidohydrolase family protein [Chloroflexi bacterium]|nr:amidohydrolase family protein [Chloroflexota bacterium]